MNSWEYRLYYRENIWRSAVLACFAEKAENFTQLEKHKSVMNNFIEGLATIQKTRGGIMSNFKFSRTSLDRMAGVNQDIKLVFEAAIDDSPIDFGIPGHGGLRTDGEQNTLFAKGLSKCDGFNVKSNHQSGNALDFYAYVNGSASWDNIHLAMVAGVILSTAKRLKIEGLIDIELEWGGTFGSDDFHGWDYPHIEIKK